MQPATNSTDHAVPDFPQPIIEVQQNSQGDCPPDDAAISGDSLLYAKRKSAPVIECVLPAYNEEENLKKLIPLLSEQLAQMSPNYAILVIDDGSEDNTAEVVAKLSIGFPMLRLIQLARNFGKESALTAGIDHSTGDVVILMDADFQHPLDMLPVFFDYWSQGYDMVYGIREARADEKAWKRHLSEWFYKFIARGEDAFKIEPNAGDFRLLDRKVVEAMRNISESTRFMKGLFSWVGFKTIGIPYRVGKRHAGESAFTFLKLSELAITGITSFTTLPLRFCAGIGAIISFFSIMYGLYILIRTLVFGVDLPGWATLVVAISLLSGIQLLFIGILGEYISKIFIEAKQRPSYIVGRKYDDPHKGLPPEQK